MYNEYDCDEVCLFQVVRVPFVFVVQMQTTFIWQALHMQLDFDSEDSQPAALNRKFNVRIEIGLAT
jgi:hypothetical protein